MRLVAIRILSMAVAAAAVAVPAWAGPPYVTDDPEPTDYHHWEIYAFAAGAHTPGETAGATGLDLNYGGAKDLQLTATLPVEFDHGHGTDWAFGDIELAAKLKVAHQDGPLGLDLAVFPRAFLPTGLDDSRVRVLLPVWVGRDIGDWSIFGGGGYVLNPGPDAKNYWQGGLAVTRQLSERFNLGAEIYSQGPDAPDAKRFTGLQVGATYKLAGPWSLIGAAGPGLENTREGGRYTGYIALKADF